VELAARGNLTTRGAARKVDSRRRQGRLVPIEAGSASRSQGCSVAFLLSKSKFFPPAEMAEPEGVVLFGGQLAPEWLLDAYAHGIFPWPIFDGTDIIVWWSPDPRAIFELDHLRISRRLARTCRGGRFQLTVDRDFAGVIHGCATAGDRAENTWLTPKMIAAYTRLHELGHAHSVEVWHEGQLAGGTYGVTLGGLYAGESMFHRQSDASKVAIVYLVAHLQARGYTLFDIQQRTPHTTSFGAVEIPRGEYLRRLDGALKRRVTFGDCLACATSLPRE
jgi:leucyl/phenylalanyl-tRNA--protein transferase